MTVAFPDLSNFQAGLRIQPGTVAVIAKATEGNYYRDQSHSSFKQQAVNEGSIFSGYHYLKAGYGAAQAGYFRDFVGAEPCMLDVEAGSGGVGDIVAFHDQDKAHGFSGVWGAYLPHWYWQEIGSPDLSPLITRGIALISSNYAAYSDTGPGWYPYGGITPSVWQYTDALPYGGRTVDFNAFKGTVQELATLIMGTPGPVPPGAPVVSVTVLGMCARSDPGASQGHTTNFNQVYPVQEALCDKGYLSNANPYWGRGAFGTMTVAAYREWQLALGYTGNAADGIPGTASLTRLGQDTGRFEVVA